MTDPIGRGTYELTADRTQLKQDLAAAEGDVAASGQVAEQQATSGLGKLKALSAPAMTAITGVGATLTHAGELALQMGDHYREATNTIIQQTGASGDKLAALQQSMRNVAGQVPESLGTVAEAVSEVSRRLDLTGPPLDTATRKFIDFARLTHQDVPTAIDSVTAAMERMQIPAEQLPEFLDKLVRANQLTGISASDLTSALASVGPQLENMGYSLDGSIALISAWSKAGGDSSELAGAMNKAFAKFAKEGATDGASAMQILVDKIKNAPNDFTAATAAVEIFGKKGTVMAQMIRDGALDVDTLTTSITNSGDALDTTTEQTKTWSERWDEFFNGIQAQVGPFASQMSDIGGALSNFGSIASTLKPIASFLIDRLRGTAEKVIPTAVVEGGLIGEAEGEAEAAGATGSKVLNSFLGKFGLMTGEKVAASTAAGLLEGEAEGTAAAEAASAPGILQKFGGAGGALGTAAAAGFGVAAAVVIDQWAQSQAKIISEARTQIQTELGNDPLAAQKAQEAIGPWRGFLDITGSVMQNFGVLGPATASVGTDIRGLGTDIDKAAASGKSFVGAFDPANVEAALHLFGVKSASAVDDAFRLQAGAFRMIGVNDVANPIAEGAGDVRSFAGIPIRMKDAVYQAWQDAPYVALGKSVPADIASGAMDNGHDLLDAGDRLIKLLKEGLSPAEEAAKLEGKKYTKAVAAGVVSEIPGAKQSAQEMAVQAIKTIAAAANGTPSNKDLKSIGSYFASLLASGMTAADALTALHNAGISDSDKAMAGIKSKYPDLFTTGQGATNQFASGTTAPGPLGNVYQGGSNVGGSWVDGLINKLRNSRTEIGNVGANALSLLMGHSPPSEGPLHYIDKMGENVGSAWFEGVAKGVNGDLSSVLGGIAGQLGQRVDGGAFDVGGAALGRGVGSTVSVGDININVNGGTGTPGEIGDAVEGAVHRVLARVMIAAQVQPLDLSGRPI